MTTRDADEDVDQRKQGGNKNNNNNNLSSSTTDHHEIKSGTGTRSKASSSTANSVAAVAAASSSWSRLKDPRIVRVSRAFGGKDRHSKVCTVRGLRDRRVRLSVPTAIQLYDLQDRLGLNQPSKVVDWLLNAAKNEIDELPPLPIPPGSFTHNLHPILTSATTATHPQSSNKQGLRIGGGSINWDDPAEPSGSNHTWNSDALFRPKSSKEVVARADHHSEHDQDKENWGRNEGGKQQHQQAAQQSHHHFESQSAYFSSNNFFSRHDQSSSSSLGLLNTTMPYNSLIRWDPSNLSLSQSGGSGPGGGLTSQQEDFHNFSVVPLPMSTPSSSLPHQQVLVYHQQPAGTTTTQSYFSSHNIAAEYGGGGRPFHLLGTTTKLLPINSQNDHGQEKQDDDDDDDFRSR